jgi:hypothetical protein
MNKALFLLCIAFMPMTTYADDVMSCLYCRDGTDTPCATYEWFSKTHCQLLNQSCLSYKTDEDGSVVKGCLLKNGQPFLMLDQCFHDQATKKLYISELIRFTEPINGYSL